MHQNPVQCIEVADTQCALGLCQPADSQLLPFISPSTLLLRAPGLSGSVSWAPASWELYLQIVIRQTFFNYLCDNINLIDFFPLAIRRSLEK